MNASAGAWNRHRQRQKFDAEQMSRNIRNSRDILVGLASIAIGLSFALYAIGQYSLGSIRHMGPGMFPAILGFMLFAIGLIVFVSALFKPGTLPSFDGRTFSFVLLAIISFALTAAYFGMVPAVVVLVMVVALADDKLRLQNALVLSVALSIIAVAIFSFGLQVPLRPVKWPF